MILSKPTIEEFVASGRISMQPAARSENFRPFGIRVHLAGEVLRPRHVEVDLSSDLEAPEDLDLYTRHSIMSQPLVLKPGEFALGSTIEAFKVDPGLACRLDGRSTLARLGLMVHCTADIIDNNNLAHRAIVLEMRNISTFTVKIPHRYGVGMLTFLHASAPIDPFDEQTQYAGQMAVTGANLRYRQPLLAIDPNGDRDALDMACL